MKENWNLIFGARLKPWRNLLLIRCLLILRSSEELASSPAFVTWSILIKKSQHLTEASLCPSVLPELTYSPFIYFSRSLCVYHLTSLPLLHSFPLLHFPSFRPCAVPPLLLLSFLSSYLPNPGTSLFKSALSAIPSFRLTLNPPISPSYFSFCRFLIPFSIKLGWRTSIITSMNNSLLEHAKCFSTFFIS